MSKKRGVLVGQDADGFRKTFDRVPD